MNETVPPELTEEMTKENHRTIAAMSVIEEEETLEVIETGMTRIIREEYKSKTQYAAVNLCPVPKEVWNRLHELVCLLDEKSSLIRSSTSPLSALIYPSTRSTILRSRQSFQVHMKCCILIVEMHLFKEKTNAVRNLLDSKDIGVWHQLTSFTNLTGDVVYTIKRQFSPELCTVAWAKMYEILHRYQLLLRQSGPIRTAHVCEAPGGFIAATNHYLRQLNGDHLDWDWVAMTLNPYFEDNDNEAMVEDDQVDLR
jgi:hypothetical protein